MKKIRICSLILLLISCVAFGVYIFYAKMTSDTVAPVVSCESDMIEVSVGMPEEVLLEGVTAMDDKSGDVTDTLVIESMSQLMDDNSRIVTYAAIDEKQNVGRLQRTVKYIDYEKPRFGLTEPLRFQTGSSFDILERVTASSTLDGNLTNSVKYSMSGSIDIYEEGRHEVEYRVTDSMGSVVYLPVEVELYKASEERISVVLSEYLIYVNARDAFDPMWYYVGSDIDGALEIQSNVDMESEGVYAVDYIVHGENSIGKSRLVVIVTGS